MSGVYARPVTAVLPAPALRGEVDARVRSRRLEVDVRYREVRTALLAAAAILTFYVGVRAYIRRLRRTAEAKPEA
jgi:hypothetical protein